MVPGIIHAAAVHGMVHRMVYRQQMKCWKGYRQKMEWRRLIQEAGKVKGYRKQEEGCTENHSYSRRCIEWRNGIQAGDEKVEGLQAKDRMVENVTGSMRGERIQAEG
jgi:hypothetical protein